MYVQQQHNLSFHLYSYLVDQQRAGYTKFAVPTQLSLYHSYIEVKKKKKIIIIMAFTSVIFILSLTSVNTHVYPKHIEQVMICLVE